MTAEELQQVRSLGSWLHSFVTNQSYRGARDWWFLQEHLKLWDLCENEIRPGHRCPVGCPPCPACAALLGREEDDSE